MRDTITVKHGHRGEPQTVDAKRINIFCHNGPDDVHVLGDDVALIDPEATAKRTAALSQQDWDSIRNLPVFIGLFRKVFADEKAVQIEDNIHRQGMGVRHVVGLILLIAEARAAGKQLHLRYPEAHLHPSAQVGLWDLFAAMTGGKP